jgi:hypothetical protein
MYMATFPAPLPISAYTAKGCVVGQPYYISHWHLNHAASPTTSKFLIISLLLSQLRLSNLPHLFSQWRQINTREFSMLPISLRCSRLCNCTQERRCQVVGLSAYCKSKISERFSICLSGYSSSQITKLISTKFSIRGVSAEEWDHMVNIYVLLFTLF